MDAAFQSWRGGRRPHDSVKLRSSKDSKSSHSKRLREVDKKDRDERDQRSAQENHEVAPLTPGEPPRSAESDAASTYRSRRTSEDASQNNFVSSGEHQPPLLEKAMVDSSLPGYAHDPTTNAISILPSSGPLPVGSPTSTNNNSIRMLSPSKESHTGRVTSLNDTELWRWNAFTHKHRKLMTMLNEATQLRRLCVDRRKDFDSEPTQSSEEGFQTTPVATRSSTRESSVDATTLHQLEMQLDQLDEQLIRHSSELIQAAPRVLNMMQKSLPILLAKDQLHFRGDPSTDSESVAFFEQDLDPVAAEISRKQDEVDALENEILMLRSTRTRKEEEMELHGNEDPELQIQAQEFLKDLDRQIAEAVTKLKTVQSELERSRDMPEKSDPDGSTQIPQPVSPYALSTTGASHLSNPYDPGGQS